MLVSPLWWLFLAPWCIVFVWVFIVLFMEEYFCMCCVCNYSSAFCDMKSMIVYLPDVHLCRLMLLTVSCIHAARPGHTALTERRDCPPSSMITCVCLCVQYVWVSMHPLNIVILLPLCSSHISYKMTHLRNCCLSTPCTPQPLPGAHGQRVCVVCVWMSAACV